ncbi:MAG TPA: DNA-processing protein DprA [Desulfatiglandales bacterium]|nr:DNA-processing protein DprA [Desulfatiglandales bacterium]
MSFEGTVIDSTHPNYPVALRDKNAQSLFARVWAIGNLALLERPLIGFFCSVKCPGELILRTYDLARALRDTGVPVISGFHSPIEKDCFDLLLKGSQPIIFCPARSIQNMRFRKSLKANIEKGRTLVLSPFEGKVRRPTAQISERRNHFVGALAATVFVSYTEPGGKTEEFCKEILQIGKLLYTFESLHNKPIIDIGAKPVTTKTITQWTDSLKRE